MAVPAEDEELKRFYEDKTRREAINATREKSLKATNFEVYHGGPHPTTKVGMQGSHGWNTGDIDFDDDGSIFIRNPYLADAIEKCIADNLKRWKDKAWRAALAKKGKEPVLFRLTRDEGWSGEKQNIVC
jgi:hypothetical protein